MNGLVGMYVLTSDVSGASVCVLGCSAGTAIGIFSYPFSTMLFSLRIFNTILMVLFFVFCFLLS